MKTPTTVDNRISSYARELRPYWQRDIDTTVTRRAGAAAAPTSVVIQWPWFNVLDYEVIGNGTDETVAIQAVLDRACAVNGTVIFPGNLRTYGVGEGLQITGACTVWIMTGATLQFVAQPAITHTNTYGGLTSSFASILYGDNLNSWQVLNEGLIDGNSYHARFNPTGFTATTGIVVNGGYGVYLSLGRVRRVNAGTFLMNTRRCTVENGRAQGYLTPALVAAEGIDDCFFNNLRAEQTHELIDFNADCDYNTVTNCIAANVLDEALDINRSSHNLFRNIYIYGNPEAMSNYQGAWAIGQLYYGLRDEVGDVVEHNGLYYRHLGTQANYDAGILSTAGDEPGTAGGSDWWTRWGCDGILLQASAGVRFSTKSGTGSNFNIFSGIDGYISTYSADAFITLQAGYIETTLPATAAEYTCINNTFTNISCLGAGRGIFVNLGADVGIEDDEDYRGDWVVDTAYAGAPIGGGDLVRKGTHLEGGETVPTYYRCIQDHLSSAANAPDVAGGDAYWDLIVEGAILETDAAAGLEVLDCYFENIARDAIRFEGLTSFLSTRVTIANITLICDTTLPGIYLENVRHVSISNIKMPAIGVAAAGIQLVNASDVNIADFYIAADDTPLATGNYGITIGGQSDRILIHSGILCNFAGPTSRGGIALVSSAANDLTAIRIENVIFEGNTWAVWDDTFAKGGNSFINDCTLISNTGAIRTPSLYAIYSLSHDSGTYAVTRAGVETLTNKTYQDPIVTGHVMHTATGAFDGHSIVRNLADAYDVMTLEQEHSSGTGSVLKLTQDGSGRIIKGITGVSEVFYVDNTGQVVSVTSGRSATFTRSEPAPAATLRTMFGLKAQRANAMVDGYGPRMAFFAQDDEAVEQQLATIGAARSGADNSGALVLETVNLGTLTEQMRILPSGYVGIGYAVPDGRLHVKDATLAAVLERTIANTTNPRSVAQVRIASSGSAADGFGPALAFDLRDAEQTLTNIIGLMSFVRAGADNTAKMLIQAATAGVLAQVLEVSNTGVLTPAGGIVLGGNETLSLYDEGTWLPLITAATQGTLDIIYTSNQGRYTRIGNLLFYTLRIQVSSITLGGASGDLRISLPVAVPSGTLQGTRGTLTTSGFNFSGAPIGVGFAPNQGTAYGTIVSVANNGGLVVEPITNLAAGDLIVASGFYYTA